MKKILAVLMAAVMVMLVSGCDPKPDSGDGSAASSSSSSTREYNWHSYSSLQDDLMEDAEETAHYMGVYYGVKERKIEIASCKASAETIVDGYETYVCKGKFHYIDDYGDNKYTNLTVTYIVDRDNKKFAFEDIDM